MNRNSKLLALVFILGLTLAVSAQSAASAQLFFPEPILQQGPPTCEVLCITSNCSSHDDCTAAPHGRCDFVCPGSGCCTYK